MLGLYQLDTTEFVQHAESLLKLRHLNSREVVKIIFTAQINVEMKFQSRVETEFSA